LLYLQVQILKMKLVIQFIFCLIVFFSCKKHESADHESVKLSGAVNVNVLTYDGSGKMKQDHSGVIVKLNSYGTYVDTKITDVNGFAEFLDIPYGSYAIEMEKSNCDPPRLKIDINNDSKSLSLPMPERSPFDVIYNNYKMYNKDSIVFSFMLDKPLELSCKIAVLSSQANGFSESFEYYTGDIITINSQTINNLNIAKLPNLKKGLDALPAGSKFYICLDPVSYGFHDLTIFSKPELLGERNPVTIQNNVIEFKKNW